MWPGGGQERPWESRRGARLEERKKMMVGGEHEEQHAQWLGDRQVWGRLRIATDSKRAERAVMAQPLGGPKLRSRARVQCLSETVSEMYPQIINVSSSSHSTMQRRVRS
jgi:hypothetical protein